MRSAGAGARGRAGAVCAAAAAVAFLAGCRAVRTVVEGERLETLVNPFAFERVAVAPFVNLSGDAGRDGERAAANAAAVFHAELQRVEGLRVAPPLVAARAMEEARIKLSGPDDAIELARALDVDAVVVGAVTSLDPYYPPRVGLAIEVYQRRPAAVTAPDILALAERGRPFPVTPGGPAPVAVLDRLYDAADRDVDRAARRFARARDASESAFDTEVYLRDLDRYLAFVCRAAIEDLFAAERRRQEATEKARPGEPP